MGRGVVWCGSDLRRLLNRIFLRPGQLRAQNKAGRAQQGTIPGIPTNFLLWQKPLGRLNRGIPQINGSFGRQTLLHDPPRITQKYQKIIFTKKAHIFRKFSLPYTEANPPFAGIIYFSIPQALWRCVVFSHGAQLTPLRAKAGAKKFRCMSYPAI